MYSNKGLSPAQAQAMEVATLLEITRRHQLKLAAAEQAAFKKSEIDAANEKLAAKFRAERERELAAEAEARRKQAAAQFEQDLRAQFFAGNEFASESDFQKVLPRMKEEAMLANARSQTDSEGRMRGTGSYVRM